ncbi:hypothetical protein [Flavobacterium sp. ALJ2]|uniref:hypothetical protein n=1 Tax=Flavobacterium sp. ALJ2 TaxID=2786960 RepID=UPI00293D95D4|nr:hypothetical protein [Flavobacterium sp. ALJ2]
MKHYQFWRHDNKPIELWSNKVIQQKINYVHNNPVEERLVYKAEDYVYSNAIDYSGQKGIINHVVVFRMFSCCTTQKDSCGSGGYTFKGKTYILDGNHKMNAAIQFKLSTGDGSYINTIIKNGNFYEADPSAYIHKVYSFPTYK